MLAAPVTTLHATCVSLETRRGRRGVLLRGPSGAGKSDLALRLIDRGARLVADDQVALTPTKAGLIARAPDRLAGRLEVRGVGIVRVRCLPKTQLHAVIDLVDAASEPRLPDPAPPVEIAGIALAHWRLYPFAESAPIKLALMVDICPLGERERDGDRSEIS